MSRFERALCAGLLILCMGGAVKLAVPNVQFIEHAAAEEFHLIPASHNTALAAPGANTDAITNITWKKQWGETLYLVVQCETSTVVNLMINDGTNEIDNGLLTNVAVIAGARYELTFRGMRAGYVINLQSETDTIWDWIDVGFVKDGR